MRVTNWAPQSWGPTGKMSPLAAWRMTSSNERTVGSLDAACEEHTHIGLPQRQGRECGSSGGCQISHNCLGTSPSHGWANASSLLTPCHVVTQDLGLPWLGRRRGDGCLCWHLHKQHLKSNPRWLMAAASPQLVPWITLQVHKGPTRPLVRLQSRERVVDASSSDRLWETRGWGGMLHPRFYLSKVEEKTESAQTYSTLKTGQNSIWGQHKTRVCMLHLPQPPTVSAPLPSGARIQVLGVGKAHT